MDVDQYIETLRSIKLRVQERIKWIELNRTRLEFTDYVSNVVACETDLVKIDLRILELEAQQSALATVMETMKQQIDQ